MRILLDSHSYFYKDPYKAFARKYNVPEKVWVELYNNRYLWRKYSFPELVEAFEILTKIEKNHQKVSEKTIRRWVQRTETYNRAQEAIGRGVVEVTLDWFEPVELDWYVVNILKKNE